MKVLKKAVVLLLFLSCMLSLTSIANADMIGHDGVTAAYKPYIISPTGTTYFSGSLLLNVSFRAEVWGNVKYTMVYSLDGQENESLPLVDHYFSWVAGAHDKSFVDGAVTLPELTDGSHSITVFLQCDWEIFKQDASYHEYYYDSQTVQFTIKNTHIQTSTPTPLTPEPINTSTPNPTFEISQEQTPAPFPTAIGLIFIVPVVGAVLGLLYYRKKHKRAL